ncbi:MAG: hypothetical protein JWR01_2926 [Subtercola sp.]|nr:hypothetical protein [Subtercola sp.]
MKMSEEESDFHETISNLLSRIEGLSKSVESGLAARGFRDGDAVILSEEKDASLIADMKEEHALVARLNEMQLQRYQYLLES